VQHLAMIMDGNRRWAIKNKLSSILNGHKKGVDSIKVSVRFCLKNKIKYLSLYTFSIENFKRPESEKSFLFNLLATMSKELLVEMLENKIRVRFVGDRSLFPPQTLEIIEEVENKTKDLDALNLNFLFCYGGRQEIVNAAKRLVRKAERGTILADQITEEVLKEELWTAGMPDPELMIRTGSKNLRISNFLLFQLAYSELMFLDCYWPEINEEKLKTCFDDFYEVKRNFGK
jgi:undecaprenyl diphosphate synthase